MIVSKLKTNQKPVQKLLPPKINRSDGVQKKTVPEGLWSKCPSCGAVLYASDLEKNFAVCPKCDYHNRIGARARLDMLLDPEGRFEIGSEIKPVDSLKFKDTRRYPDRLVEAEKSTGETDALIVGAGPVGLFQVFELGLLGQRGSGGSSFEFFEVLGRFLVLQVGQFIACFAVKLVDAPSRRWIFIGARAGTQQQSQQNHG